VVLAIVRPDWLVTTVDAVAKKAAFVRQVVGELELPNLQPIHGRVEKLALAPKFDLIVSRAFASLAEFVDGTQALVAPNGVWVAMKGQTPKRSSR
jgi:16S rRNA (guanine527-N7)-methyltransferase